MKTKPGKVSVSSKTKPTATKKKPVSKAAAKPAAKGKPVAGKKPVAKNSKPAAGKKPATKAKPVAKAKVKPAAKPKAKAPLKAAKPAAKAGKLAAKPAKPVAKAPAKGQASTKPLPAAVVAAVQRSPAVAGVAASAARPGRPSSRLAQLTVPSMAQSVASTAAKASYQQNMSTTLIAPPPVPTTIKKDPKLANNWRTKPAEELSDAELIAMPDSEYMNEKQLAAFRFKLLGLKQDILSNAGETTEHLREDTVVVPDPADRATIEEEHALELRTRDRERKLLKKIEQSIDRIDAGDYGYCDETGEPIGVGRLLARPTATLSLEAQQRRELKQKMFGD